MTCAKSKAVELYIAGRSIPDVADLTGLTRSTVRRCVAKAGALRGRADGVRLASAKLSVARRGRTRRFTDAHKKAISESRRAHAEENAAGVSLKPSGYIEYTCGPHKGRCVHVVMMEERIGRRLRRDEVVHHIDHDKANNDINNLALMTRAAHARLHRREERISRKAA